MNKRKRNKQVACCLMMMSGTKTIDFLRDKLVVDDEPDVLP